MCVCVRGRQCVCERERECVCERERGSVGVTVHELRIEAQWSGVLPSFCLLGERRLCY